MMRPCNGCGQPVENSFSWCKCCEPELRARREQDLSAEDVEALRWARGQMRVIQLHGEQPAVSYAAKAGAVLDRILKGADRGE